MTENQIKSDRNKEYYNAFNELDEDWEKENLLSRVFIMDASPSITDIEDVLAKNYFIMYRPWRKIIWVISLKFLKDGGIDK